VHRHLDDQLFFLAGRDDGLHGIIESIRVEEELHLHTAESQISDPGAGRRLLHRAITAATDAVIWLSTWGDSSRMARELRRARLH
jgi:ubiquinone biosynthesis monooxygenase Coq7